MSNPFKKAKRAGIKLRAAISGPPGGGKSVSALRLAHCLRRNGLGKKIAVIDTECRSTDQCADDVYDGEPFDFDSMELRQFSPSMYKAAIEQAESNGYDIIVIDSLSHEWIGEGGALDLVDQKGGKFSAWKDVTPLHRQLIDRIIRSKANIVATLRTKVEYVMETEVNKQGKEVSVPKKVGMAPVQREGLEYEFSVVGEMTDQSNQIKISKSRCAAMQGATAIRPGDEFWKPLMLWLQGASQEDVDAAVSPMSESLGQTLDRLRLMIDAVTTKEMADGVKGTIKAEIDRLPSASQDELRQVFVAKVKSLAQ